MSAANQASELSPDIEGSKLTRSSEDPFVARVFLVVAVIFVGYSLIRIPVPAVNEPHYMAKAKYFWNPEWCQEDFFLSSPNPHLVFYAVTGWLPNVVSLEVATVLLRIASLALVAFGWTFAFSALTQSRWGPLWMACLFLLLQTIGSFSGEWIVGGVESKVFTYGFVFLSLGFAFRNRWSLSATSLGATISFHPVIGIWAMLCGLFAFVVMWLQSSYFKPSLGEARKAIVPLLLLIVAALPGLIPALWLLMMPSESEVSFQADFIAVFYRLKHHLDPMKFKQSAYMGYLVLGAFWLVSVKLVARSHFQKWFGWFVLASILVAMIGLLTGLRSGPVEDLSLLAMRMKILKFYPFRLFDALLPLACCLNVVVWAQKYRSFQQPWAVVVPAMTITIAMLLPGPDQNPSRLSDKRKVDWIRMTDWIEENTARDAEFITPKNAWAFKWFASRSEYVAYKDIPQDATGMVEWKKRLQSVRGWAKQAASDDLITREETDQLYRMTQADYLIVQWLAPFEYPADYRNKSFRVFRISPIENRVD